MFTFLNQDLDSLLSDKWKHDQRSKRVCPTQVHGIAHQHGDKQNQRKVRITERENCRRFQRLTSQLYRKRLHIRAGDGYHEHRNRGDDDAEHARPRPPAEPQRRCAKVQTTCRRRHVSIGDESIPPITRNRFVAYGYMTAAAGSLYLGASTLWLGRWPRTSMLGIVVAAISMLVIPIAGSYMKTLAVELRSQALKSAAIFTFGNSYLSLVLLIAMLMSYAMNLRWGDPLGALVMFPFIAQKGIQILVEEGKHEYVED